MRSFINAMTVTKNASACQDCVKVAGMVALRAGGPQRPHLYRARPVSPTLASLAGRGTSCRLERGAEHRGHERTSSARPCTHRRSAWRVAARIS